MLFSWCCLPYKGTNFSANHNQTNLCKTLNKMLFTLQRYEFFSKSQRYFCTCSLEKGCCLPYKGTNFSANHNKDGSTNVDLGDVVYPTKVRIFQQITTWIRTSTTQGRMLFTLQRYEFFSKSQLVFIIMFRLVDVVYPTKVRIFQQITTVSQARSAL